MAQARRCTHGDHDDTIAIVFTSLSSHFIYGGTKKSKLVRVKSGTLYRWLLASEVCVTRSFFIQIVPERGPDEMN